VEMEARGHKPDVKTLNALVAVHAEALRLHRSTLYI
jgi:hypothetical protein